MRSFPPLAPLSMCIAASAWSCGGAQSALNPAGHDAEQIATLFTVMAIGALAIWALVLGCALYAVVRADHRHPRRAASRFIIGGGIILPTVVLTALLSWGLAMLPEVLDPGRDKEPSIRVSAEQWWWRVSYRLPDGSTVELANELRLPVGKRLSIAIASPDVIHSFWIPALGGKVDAIPGRTTTLALEPTRTGVFRGLCAEYCGLSHALMMFSAVTMAEPDYRAWLAHQATPARTSADPQARRGARAFDSYGCGACHSVRGTPADGALGPDLTHVGSRTTIAGVLDNDVEGFRSWIIDPESVKPGAHMPAFGMIPEQDSAALAAYLESLQ